MGMLGAIYHGIKGGYNLLVNNSDDANLELDKAVESLHKTIIIDPIGISDIADIANDISEETE